MSIDPDHPCSMQSILGASYCHISGRRVALPRVSGDATVMKGTIRSERDSSLYVPTRGVPPAIRQPSAAPQ